MNKQAQAVRNDVGTLAEDAALETGKEVYGRVRDKAIEGVQAADETVREHPYQAIGLAFGVGALLGYLILRRPFRNGD